MIMKNIAAALAKFQQAMEPVVKDRENPHFKNKYATMDAILEAVKKPMATAGLAFCQYPCGLNKLKTVIWDVASGESIEGEMEIAPDRAGPQAVGSAFTYMRRYSLGSMLGIATEEDDDAQASEKRPAVSTALLSDAQRTKIWALAHEKGFTPENMNETSVKKYGVRISSLSKDQASEVIESMSK